VKKNGEFQEARRTNHENGTNLFTEDNNKEGTDLD
jgi:hypothetical protein